MDIDQRYQQLLEPSDNLVADISKIEGDIIILGVGGKMGPDLARLAVTAIRKAGSNKKVYGVARFSEPELRNSLQGAGVETIQADLLDDNCWSKIPEVPNVLYLAGTKFGTKGNEAYTWAMNTYLPSRVAAHFKRSRIVAFSTGNVYPLSVAAGGGLTEDCATGPVGEYGQSCLGRERIFQYFSAIHKIPLLIYRLNYANDVKYGVLLEIARSVWEGREIDVEMGNVNVIWQKDANEFAIRSLRHCATPPKTLNITGPENISVRWLANWFGERFSREPKFWSVEAGTALLSNAAESFRLFGYPSTPLKTMMLMIADWVASEKQTINKPTHFQERHGNY